MSLKRTSHSVYETNYHIVWCPLWAGELWEDGYFVRTVWSRMTSEVIKRYIQRHREIKQGPEQLRMKL